MFSARLRAGHLADNIHHYFLFINKQEGITMFTLFNRANKANIAQLTKSTAYVTALSAVTYWCASEEDRQRKELEKANPTCNVVRKYVPVSSSVGYFELVLEPKIQEGQQPTRLMRR